MMYPVADVITSVEYIPVYPVASTILAPLREVNPEGIVSAPVGPVGPVGPVAPVSTAVPGIPCGPCGPVGPLTAADTLPTPGMYLYKGGPDKVGIVDISKYPYLTPCEDSI